MESINFDESQYLLMPNVPLYYKISLDKVDERYRTFAWQNEYECVYVSM